MQAMKSLAVLMSPGSQRWTIARRLLHEPYKVARELRNGLLRHACSLGERERE